MICNKALTRPMQYVNMRTCELCMFAMRPPVRTLALMFTCRMLTCSAPPSGAHPRPLLIEGRKALTPQNIVQILNKE